METQPETRKGSWKIYLAITILVLLVLLSITLVYDAMGRVRLSQAIKAAEDHGGPITFEQLMAARRKYPDDKNGANVILGVKDRLEAINKDERFENVPILGRQGEAPALGQRLSAEAEKAARDLLVSSQTELATVDTIKQYEGGRFPLEIAPRPIDTLLPHIAWTRVAAKLKRLQVLDRAMRGDTSLLMDDVTVMTRIADLLADEPTLISSLVHIACLEQAVFAIEESCGLAPVSPPQLLELQKMLRRIDERPHAIIWGMRGERAFFIETMDYIRKTGDYSIFGANQIRGATLASKLPGMRGFMMFDQAAGINRYNHIVAAVEKSQGYESIKVIEDKSKLAANALMSRIMAPSVSIAVARNIMLMAEVRAAQVAMAVERYKIDTGNLPTELFQLLPKYLDYIPPDPFKTDQTLKYAVKSDRVVIYSIGEDGIDNGGDVNHGSSSKGQTDCGFILLLPAARNLPPLPTTTTSAPSE